MSTASRYTPDEPIAAIATALAPSALAVVRVSGKNCIELVSRVFSRPAALLKASPYTMLHGWIVAPAAAPSSTGSPQGAATTGSDSALAAPESGTRSPQTATTTASATALAAAPAGQSAPRKIDEVMLAVYRAPKSFTGEDMVEITCHGGSAPVLAVYQLLLQSGFRPAERGEYSFRAFVNGKLDLTRAEAIREIIESRTDTSRSRAAGRLSGALFDQIEAIKQLLVRTTASIEAEIEYPEDEEAIADAFDATELVEAARLLRELGESWAAEKLYQDGARVVLAGRTNAGKSSLFNTLLKEDRAIVSDVEGTTRDYLESWVSFKGVPARLFDTAGLRATTDSIEATGVERSRELAGEADVVLYLADALAGYTDEDRRNLAPWLGDSALAAPESGARSPHEAAPQTKAAPACIVAPPAKLAPAPKAAPGRVPVVFVWNKTDRAPAPGSAPLPHGLTAVCAISAKTGVGVGALAQTVHDILTRQNSTTRAQAGLGSERQKRAVDEALESVTHALHAQDYGLGLDAAVQDIEDALTALGEITGEVSPDDILGNIFSRFCVGK